MNLNSTKIIFSVYGTDYLNPKYRTDHMYIMDNLLTDKLNPMELFGETNRQNMRYIMLESWNETDYETNLDLVKRLSHKCNQESFLVVDQDGCVNKHSVLSFYKNIEYIGDLKQVDGIEDDYHSFFYEPQSKRYFIVEETK
jgi:hypothetical protein